ncbi:hypothetical protein BD311DRAFT_380114 [Dichomitus squalens]|uniref:Uncharacterized protein n=1 Tax=Dichomitus squalens TaxID=114155 RepID=A0A4Q9MKX8_9APHY|nr:hypothetical protein BD311DRAFT_380114 [Dichomitus squalens]
MQRPAHSRCLPGLQEILRPEPDRPLCAARVQHAIAEHVHAVPRRAVELLMADNVSIAVVEPSGDPLWIVAMSMVPSAVIVRLARPTGCMVHMPLHYFDPRYTGVKEVGPHELFADALEHVFTDELLPGANSFWGELDWYCGRIAMIHGAELNTLD